jgi:hypothetical protein
MFHVCSTPAENTPLTCALMLPEKRKVAGSTPALATTHPPAKTLSDLAVRTRRPQLWTHRCCPPELRRHRVSPSAIARMFHDTPLS